MNLLKEILSELHILNEDAAINDVNDAIQNMHKVKITYDKNGHNRARIICPVAYGISTAGNPVVRAFQEAGDTNTSVPKWKLFRLERILSWENLSNQPYDIHKLVGFNKNGDEQIETLYTIAPIGKGKNTELIKNPDGELTAPITDKPVSKVQITQPKKSAEVISRAENSSYTANDAVNDVILGAKNTNKGIDNEPENTYTSSDNIDAEGSSPIFQGDITGSENDSMEIAGQRDAGEEENKIENEPIKKDELNQTGEPEALAEIKDLIKRMNKVVF